MAENVTPVVLEIDGFAQREVMMIDYKFDQATDTEGQIAGIPRGGRVTIRVKALNDGNNELIAWMLDPTSPKNVSVKFVNTRERFRRLRQSLEVGESYYKKRSLRWPFFYGLTDF